MTCVGMCVYLIEKWNWDKVIEWSFVSSCMPKWLSITISLSHIHNYHWHIPNHKSKHILCTYRVIQKERTDFITKYFYKENYRKFQLSYTCLLTINFYFLPYKYSMWPPPAVRSTSVWQENSFQMRISMSCSSELITVVMRLSRLVDKIWI